MNSFEYAVQETLDLEGGYSNDPTDRGGETNYGITKTLFDYAVNKGIISGVSDIKDITVSQAKAIYKYEFWDSIRLTEIKDDYIAAEIFDTAVNSGTRKAIIITQMALDYLGEVVDIDGKIGSQTIGLINKWSVKDPRALYVALNGFQFIHYVLIVDDYDLIEKLKTMVKADGDQTKFARGWTKRIQDYKTGVDV